VCWKAIELQLCVKLSIAVLLLCMLFAGALVWYWWRAWAEIKAGAKYCLANSSPRAFCSTRLSTTTWSFTLWSTRLLKDHDCQGARNWVWSQLYCCQGVQQRCNFVSVLYHLCLLLRLDRGAEYCDQVVCVFVCLSASISLEPLDRSSQKFFAEPLWPWLGPPLTLLRYVMDDVTFGHSGLYGDAWKAETLTYYH